MGDPTRDPNERPDTLSTIGPPDDVHPATQETGYQEAEDLDPDTSSTDPAAAAAS